MMALAFGLKASRVLIITPAATLRDQTAEKFRDLDDLKTTGVLDGTVPSPMVLSNAQQLGSRKAWLELQSLDVVVATPKTTSPSEPGVCAPPKGIFDLVFIDEAHHAPAPTWASILRAFGDVRCVLLTATPFRRDNRLIHAPLIYHYSIAKALDDDIYRPIKYEAVAASIDRSVRDEMLCQRAAQILKKEHKKGNNSKLLIRADRVDWAKRLAHLYKARGIKVESVDYQRSKAENDETIAKVKSGELDGMVCVGMVGEGLDIPELKIAVLHAAPKSLPFTLQFIGRVSRPSPTQSGDAYLLSVPDEVTGEMRRLHRADSNWRKLVPKLAEIAVGKAAQAHSVRLAYDWEDIDLNPLDLRPFFSVRVLETAGKSFDFAQRFALEERDPASSLVFQELPYSDLAVYITETRREPAWAVDTGLNDVRYDLHLFVWQKGRKLLFELTTSPELVRLIREALAFQDLISISASRVLRVMQSSQPEYYMVGLRNALGAGAAQPAYKTMMGSTVEAAVRPLDGQVFAPGHALMQVRDGETRGIATAGGRIWAIKRGDIAELKRWCEEMGQLIASSGSTPDLPNLEFLASGQEIGEVPERPIAILLDERTLRASRSITLNGVLLDGPAAVPFMTIEDFKLKEVFVKFHFHSGANPIDLTYSLSGTPDWTVVGSDELRIALEFSENEFFQGALIDYLQEFPPRLIMPNGGSIAQRQLWKPPVAPPMIPADVWEPIAWTGCKITNETKPGKKGALSIQQFVEQRLMASRAAGAILIRDHGSGEMADFIVIDPSARSASFYHCKGSGGKKPGVRVGDCYEVLAQACRNARWVRFPQLLDQVSHQTKPTRNSPIVTKNGAVLEAARTAFQSNAWSYKVVVVQPGIDGMKAAANRKVNSLFVSLYQILRDYDASLSIWCS